MPASVGYKVAKDRHFQVDRRIEPCTRDITPVGLIVF
jgi:hypothetical protein